MNNCENNYFSQIMFFKWLFGLHQYLFASLCAFLFPKKHEFEDGAFRPDHFIPSGAAVQDIGAYEANAYQYASTSHPERCQPAKIHRPWSDEEVVNIIDCAHRNGVALSVRSGGHHFAGFSSTSGSNEVVDMSHFNAITKYLGGVVKVGAGCRLGDLDVFLQSIQAIVSFFAFQI